MLLLGGSLAALCIESAADAQGVRIDVPALPVTQALGMIARQSGVRIVYDPNLDAGMTSAPVRGAVSARQAVEMALRGLDFGIATEADGSISVDHNLIVVAYRDEAEVFFRVDDAQSSNRGGKSLRELPQTTEVITSALIQRQQSLTLSDALRNSGGVVNSVGNVQGTPSFAIRGQASSALQNGVQTGANAFTIDAIERIEILKGPAAILSGANNLGGAVNIVDKRPSSTPVLDISAFYGTFDYRKMVIDASDALTTDKTLSARIIGAQGGASRSYGDYGRESEAVIAPSLRYKTNSSDVIVGLNAAESFAAAKNFRYIDPNDPGRFLSGTGRLGPKGQGFNNNVTRYYLNAEQRIASWLTLSARGSITNDNLSAKIYQPADFLDPATPLAIGFASGFRTEQRNRAADMFVRLDVRTGPLRHKIVAGYNYTRLRLRQFDQDPTIDPVVFFNPQADNSELPLPAAATSLSFLLEQKQNGFYVQDFVDIGPVHIVASLRRDRYVVGTTIFGVNAGTRNRTAAMTPNVGAVLDVSKTLSLYANFQRGFSPNTALSCDGARLPNIRTENIEAGAKADLFARKLSLTASAYQLAQDGTSNPDATCPVGNRFISAGGLRTRGVDLSAAGDIGSGLSLNASYSFADYGYRNTAPEFGTLPNGLYRHKYSIFAAYEARSGPLSGLGLAAGVFGNGRTYVDTFGKIHLDPQAQVDANLTYRLGGTLVNLGIKNLFDADLNSVAFTPLYVARLQPRTILLSVTHRFFR